MSSYTPSTTTTAENPTPSQSFSSTKSTLGSHTGVPPSSSSYESPSSTVSNVDSASPNPTTASGGSGVDSNTQSQSSAPSDDYPEQRHAGAVGYGPQYRQGVSVGDKLTGLKEELKGKVTKNPELVEQGKERRTGELKKKQEQEDTEKNDPFKEPGEDNTQSTQSKPAPTQTSTADAPKTSSAFGTSSTSAPPQPQFSAQRDAQGQEIAAHSGSGMKKPGHVVMVDENGQRRKAEPDSIEDREPGDIARETVGE
ncbi:hypothetical protein GYMLUDRAFT_263155 [Collybiopsis luxurians FD-317 M1]|uniref:Uncharacterized protein n=1 Tax=Collybiopsis luxurians FD-317 M1 TaxID=944289 RepID=A0A0D0BQJ7_9AGAR|nr:hypothetical protein GYMLUDRAFT_263155 [Collybiopsis luxurians FD-317 M1]